MTAAENKKAYNVEYRRTHRLELRAKGVAYHAAHKTETAEYARNNRDRISKYQVEYRKANREKAKKYLAEYYLKNKEKLSANQKQYNESHKETRNAWECQHRNENPGIKMAHNMRVRIRQVIKKNLKSASTFDLLGCSRSELCAHLEKQFVPGMTWENYGPVWHVDHIKPCISFNFTDPKQQRVCFHYTNLQPLFAAENIRKGGRS